MPPHRSIHKKKRAAPAPAAPLVPPQPESALRRTATALQHAIHTHPRIVDFTLVVLIVAVGVVFRFEDLGQWHRNEAKAFFQSEPIHTTFDAWFYLSLSQDLLDDSYERIDTRRGVPESPRRPWPPPLLSILAAALVAVTPFSLSWIGAVLPALLGPLLALPAYKFGHRFGGRICGATAALLSVLYPFYIHRSNIGRFDTDCLNVTFALWTSYLCMRFAFEQSRRRYGYLLAMLPAVALYAWWWDQAPAAVTAVVSLPLIVGIAFFYRAPRREAFYFAGALLATAGVFVAVAGPSVPVRICTSLWEKYLYITKETGSIFPNIGLTISEQSIPSLEVIIGYTSGTAPAFMIAAAGLAALLYRHLRPAAFLVSLVALSIFSFTSANRFLIFLIPLLGLGSGYAVACLWELRHRAPLCSALLLLTSVPVLVYPLYSSNAMYTQWPKEPGVIVEGMDAARRKTPADAVIWAWWDHGYALTYYARRGTINDGSIHSGERTVYTALPLAAHDFRFSANFMHFYVARGMSGIRTLDRALNANRQESLQFIRTVLAAGPDSARAIIAARDPAPQQGRRTVDDWLEFLFPRQNRPVYLFLDHLLTRTAYWWYWFGTWDIASQQGTHPTYKMFYRVARSGSRITAGDGLQVDTASGNAFVGPQSFTLAHLTTRTPENIRQQHYYNGSDNCFEYSTRRSFGALMDTGIAESVFNRLFMRGEFPKEYFKPVVLNAPYYQIWEVRADTLGQ